MIERRRRGEDKPQQQTRNIVFWIRQVLNILFMIGAIVGVALYLLKPQEIWGIVVIVSAMVLKTFECLIRMFKIEMRGED